MTGNGRIPCINLTDQFKLYDKIDVKYSPYSDALVGIWNKTPLSCKFFSAENIKYLNDQIILNIRKKSNGKYNIGPQSQDELKTIMRSIYLEYSRNMLGEIPEQLNALNNKVLNFAIPKVFASIQSYAKYLEDISSTYQLMDRPIYSNMDDKTLSLNPWF